MRDLAQVVDRLATGDGPLRQAADALHTAIQSNRSGT